MHVLEIPEENLRLYLPSDLSECDKDQYIKMCDLIFRLQNNYITYDDLRYQAVYRLLNLKKTKSHWENDETLKYSNIAAIAELIEDFFDTDESGQKILKQYYTHNPVPSIKPLLKSYYGPSDSFMNLTFGEYTDALRLFHDFYASGDTNLLYLMTAIFYREKKSFHFIKKRLQNYDGDIRNPYNSQNIENRAEKLKYAPFGFIYGTFLFFASFQKFLVEAKIPWGGQELDLSILFDSKKPEGNQSNAIPGIGMDSIAFSIAETGAFGNLEKVRATNFWQIIVRMYDLQKTNLEQKLQDNGNNK